MRLPAFTQFVVKLSTDHKFLKRFHENAIATMKASGLSDEEMAIILSENSQRINKKINAQRGAHRKPMPFRKAAATGKSAAAGPNGAFRKVTVTPSKWKVQPPPKRGKL